MNSKIKESKSMRTSTSPRVVAKPTDILANNMGKGKKLYTIMFEVYGRVQGVYFRKHTHIKAKELGLTGWCMNTKDGTVKGVLEGSQDLLSEMQLWLQHKGSPRSLIERVVFSPLEPIDVHNFSTFKIHR